MPASKFPGSSDPARHSHKPPHSHICTCCRPREGKGRCSRCLRLCGRCSRAPRSTKTCCFDGLHCPCALPRRYPNFLLEWLIGSRLATRPRAWWGKIPIPLKSKPKEYQEITVEQTGGHYLICISQTPCLIFHKQWKTLPTTTNSSRLRQCI